MARLPFVDPAKLTPEQQQVYDQIAGGARGRVGFMYRTLLHSPGLAAELEGVGAYLRYKTKLSEKLKEFAICIVAAHWKADVEWASHSTLAKKEGMSEGVLADVAADRAPAFTDPQERIVYDYVRETLAGGGIDDRVYEPAIAAFGAEALLDLTAIAGYYTMLAMVLNAFDVRPPDAVIPWRPAQK